MGFIYTRKSILIGPLFLLEKLKQTAKYHTATAYPIPEIQTLRSTGLTWEKLKLISSELISNK